ncbi:MAG: HPF/RaiA family ribosome-associated protein [Minisyncoccia bacterium]
MEIKIILDNFDLLDKQRELIEKKLKPLKKYLRRYSLKDIEIILSSRQSQEKGNVIGAEVKVILPGKDLFLKEEGENIPFLINKIKKELKDQLINLNKKKQSRLKRLGRFIKEKFFR